MVDLIWQDNTEEIYEKCISLAPGPFRKITRKNLTEALEKKVEAEGIVSEEVLVACIKEVTPKPFLAMGMEKIQPMLKGTK
jgi:hypothetical protein